MDMYIILYNEHNFSLEFQNKYLPVTALENKVATL